MLLRTGKPDVPSAVTAAKYGVTFPNRLVASVIKNQILALLSENPDLDKKLTMKDVRDIIESGIEALIKAGSKPGHVKPNVSPGERLAIRKMMSRYWENSSIFALELGGAVLRQSIFVEKMHKIDWLHSGQRNTMTRLIEKYKRFFKIMATYPSQTAVPTLDVDLAWHTHQLSPRQYYLYSTVTCKKFINHDDKIAEDKLNESFEWTSKVYEKLFGEVYAECTCWYCEG